jgi:Ca2+-transporting ATPase
LKAAHIGIAMGRRGTDVAREAASLVLLEDDFSAIVAAVGLGRRIFANLRQAMVYTLGVHIPIIGLSLLPLLLGLPPLLAPIHIAFLELVIDPTCSVVLEAEPATPAQMAQPPRRQNAPLLSASAFLLSALLGSLATLAALAVYGGALATDWALPQARALAFITLIGAITSLLFSSRRASPSLGGGLQGLSTVGWLVVVVVLALLPAITGIEALASAFTFQPPGILAGLAALALGLACYPSYEALKALFGSGRNETV